MQEEQFTIGDLVTHGTYMLYDSPDKTVWLTRDGDQMYQTVEWKHVSALLEDNQSAANAFSRSSRLGDNVQVASVPMGVYQRWVSEGIVDDPVALARRLNDAEYRKFRTNNLQV
ncbi:hypothetical protein [Agrobacterium rosae]|uniref:Uncharacterized protein n=1 Tax=Agrobacterium rosae TaxID=1972867 RepID=A0A1R3U506_9HYPH|nr:hypothetical protein [Agrobacterium rosae]SCX36036.1 hypothetical protein DSM25559_5291 [Agrobacterium rosae]